MSSIELPTRENIDEAIVVSDTGSRNSALMVANVTSSENELILPENENTSQAVWVDSDGKRHKVQMTANIYGGGSGSGAVDSVNGKTGVVVLDAEDVGATTKNIITLTGESGTLTSAQIAQVLDDTSVLEIVCDGVVFHLSNKQSNLTYRTFMSMDVANTENVSFKAIYINVSEGAANYGAWTLEEESAGGGAIIPSTTPTLTVAGWSNKSQTISVTGVTASNVVLVSPAPASASDYAAAGIICTAQASDSLTFTCETVPTSAIDLSIVIL